MSGETEEQLNNGVLTPDLAALPPPRFTAANGQNSPPQNPQRREPANALQTSNEDSTMTQSIEDSVYSGTIPERAQQGGSIDSERRESTSSSTKRKRSSSVEESPSTSTSHHNQKRRLSPHNPRIDPFPQMSNGGVSQQYVNQETSRPQTDAHTDQYTEAREQSWAHPHREGSSNTDARLAEALQRESQHLGSQQLQANNGSQDQRFSMSAPPRQDLQAPIQISPGSVGTPLGKQRKRHFSNRTKTGCLTCRERKKKCDEAKPTCNNCHRGGFVCKGYSQGNPLYKPTNAREQPVLQARSGALLDPGAQYVYPPRSLPGPEYYPNGHPNMRGRPLGSEDDREHLRNIPDQNVRAGFERQSWPENHHPNHNVQYSPPDGVPRTDFQQTVPPLSDISREQKKLPPPPQPTSQRTGSSTAYNHRTTAQLALQQTTSRPQPLIPAAPMYRTEKEKMLHRVPFMPSDQQLKNERHLCSVALYKFNKNAVDPTTSEDERTQQFSQILAPNGRSTPPSESNADPSVGFMGERIDVQAPFNCQYGYNIHIGDDVEIGANCRIMDAASVRIGARTVIGPDVSIYSVDGDHYNKPPAGMKRLWLAEEVIIEEDCWIGGGAIILPGVRIEKGSTVGAGTIVPKNVKNNCTVINHGQLRALTARWGHGHGQRYA